ncbi:hypothetical protein KI387_040790, partial [Taxus chinensis]
MKNTSALQRLYELCMKMFSYEGEIPPPPVITRLKVVLVGGMRLAKLKVDSVYIASSGSSVLYPTKGGNIHSFTALTSCAVLDVLSPPYADGEPSYYSINSYSGPHCK